MINTGVQLCFDIMPCRCAHTPVHGAFVVTSCTVPAMSTVVLPLLPLHLPLVRLPKAFSLTPLVPGTLAFLLRMLAAILATSIPPVPHSRSSQCFVQAGAVAFVAVCNDNQGATGLSSFLVGCCVLTIAVEQLVLHASTSAGCMCAPL